MIVCHGRHLLHRQDLHQYHQHIHSDNALLYHDDHEMNYSKSWFTPSVAAGVRTTVGQLAPGFLIWYPVVEPTKPFIIVIVVRQDSFTAFLH